MGSVATSDELMRYLGVGGDNPARVNPERLTDALNAAEGWAKRYTGRVFGPEPALVSGADTGSPVTKTFAVRKQGWIRIPDLRTATAVTLNGTALVENTDYVFEVYSGEEPHTMIRLVNWTAFTSPFNISVSSSLAITGRWGMYPVPDEVKDAVLTLAARQYRRQDAMFSDVVDTGAGIYEFSRGVPDSVKTALDLYRTPQVSLV